MCLQPVMCLPQVMCLQQSDVNADSDIRTFEHGRICLKMTIQMTKRFDHSGNIKHVVFHMCATFSAGWATYRDVIRAYKMIGLSNRGNASGGDSPARVF